MNSDLNRDIGRLEASVEGMTQRLSRIGDKLEEHMKSEERRLRHIEEQLSLARFLWFIIKAVVLTIVAVLAFKFGDVKGLWKF